MEEKIKLYCIQAANCGPTLNFEKFRRNFKLGSGKRSRAVTSRPRREDHHCRFYGCEAFLDEGADKFRGIM